MRAHRLRAAWGRGDCVASGARGALGDREEPFERLAGLLDAALSKIPQLIWNIERRIVHLHPFRIIAVGKPPAVARPFNALFAAVQHKYDGGEKFNLAPSRRRERLGEIRATALKFQ
jgi:hypothetical protein